MTDLLLSQANLDFLLHDVLDVDGLTELPHDADATRDVVDDVLALSRELAVEHFLPVNRAGDLDEPRVEDGVVRLVPEAAPALRAFLDAGLGSLGVDAEYGGGQLPHVVRQASFLWFQAAAIGLASYPLLTAGAANLLVRHGSPEQVDTYARPMIEGRWSGTMCLSEPDVGSSLADVRTTAKRQDDGTYRLTGQKMWISGGDHELTENIVHLVLARTPDGPAGVKGLSLFVVPKRLPTADGSVGERNDVRLIGLNHKMGWRGTTNTLLAFGEDGGAVGHIIGREGDGLAHMFAMMNEARIGVGAGGAALASAAYLHALAYARERRQGRVPGEKDPMSQPVLLTRHADVRRMLLAAKAYAEGSVALVLYAARLLDTAEHAATDGERRAAGELLDILTPVVKTWPSEWGLATTSLAIQVLGGAGYTRDHPVEQHLRDSRLNPIHEGTTGIHGVDLLGRKVRQHGGAGFLALVEAVRATVAETPEANRRWADALAARVDRLVEVTGLLTAEADVERSLSDATAYLEATGHVVVAWLWLRQANAVDGRTGPFADGKRAATEYFMTRELPLVDQRLDLLAAQDRLLVDLDPDCL